MMLLNRTQEKAHNAAVKKVHEQAKKYLAVVDDPLSMNIDVSIARAHLSMATGELMDLNELMGYTAHESSLLTQALQDYLNPNIDSYETIQNIALHTSSH